MPFIAGGYTATLDGNALGVVENGYSQELTPGGENITGDNLGPATIQDGVYQGAACFVDIILSERSAAAAVAAMWPWATTWGFLGTPGVLYSSVAVALVLTAITGPSPLPATTRTYGNVLLAPNFPVREALATRHNKIPLRFLCLPYLDTGNNKFWVDV